MVDLDKEIEVNKLVTKKESNEFLKLIKHSDIPYVLDIQL